MIEQKILNKYLENGYTLFSLNGKKPTVKWGFLRFNPLLTAQDFPYGNYGVKLGPEDLVVDIDPRNFNGVNPVPLLQSAINFQFKEATFTVKTGGGGLHLYFKKDPSIAVRGALKEYPGIEFKSVGCYVVGADSVHPDTKKPYLIIYDRPVAACPQSLLDLLCKTGIAAAPGIIDYVSDRTKDTK